MGSKDKERLGWRPELHWTPDGYLLTMLSTHHVKKLKSVVTMRIDEDFGITKNMLGDKYQILAWDFDGMDRRSFGFRYDHEAERDEVYGTILEYMEKIEGE